MTITQLHGDNLIILPTLAIGSIQALITSPPYFGLRSYSIPPSDWPEVVYTPLIGLPPVTIPAMSCQLGAESDPLAYIGHLVHVFRLARPALRGDGTLFLNLADSYSGSSMTGGNNGFNASGGVGGFKQARQFHKKPQTEAPQRYRLRRNLTPEQRAHVLRELAAHSEIAEPSSPDSTTGID